MNGSVVAIAGDAAKAIGPRTLPRAWFAGAGGPAFAVVLVLASAFTVALLDLRASKIFTLPQSAAEASAEDLVAFFRAGAMAAEDRAAQAYDASAFREGLAPQHQGMLWLNPPHALLVVTPLGAAPYGMAKLALIALSALSLALIARMAKAPPWLSATLLISPAAFASLLVMQTGPLIAVGLLAALKLAGPRPIAAGLVLALLTMKPQYGLIAPVFLVALGHWRAIGAAAIFSALFVALSIALFGTAPWAAFFDSLTGGAISAHAGNLHRDMLSAASTLAKLGMSSSIGVAGQAATILLGGLAVFIAARRWPQDGAIGFALLVSAAASPSLWVYDWPLVAAGLLMLVRASAGAPWPAPLQLAAGFLWLGPLYSLGLGTIASSLIAPLLLALTLVLAWFWGGALRARPEHL